MCGSPATLASKAGKKPSFTAAGRNAPVAPRIARSGTVLMREHSGVRHQVTVLDEGVSWRGKTYDSLSQVAFAITGTKWNGPRFFGLREKQGKEGRAERRSGSVVDTPKILTAKIAVASGRTSRTTRASARALP